MDSFEIQQKRKHLVNSFQKSVIIGSILGDGHLLKTTFGYSLRCNHGSAQKELVDWKYSVLRSIATPPKIYKSSYYFRTVSHPLLNEYRDLFYTQGRKIIPDRLATILDPIVLAVWIMDDGTNELGYSRCLRINTQCFTFDEHLKLQRIFNATFGISTTVNRDKHYFRLRVAKKDMPLLCSLVERYIIPNMRYKISP